MRAKEFLIEYKRDITAQKLGSRLTAAGKREGVTDVDKILSALEEMDPTPNKQYMIWLANQYISEKFRLEDSPRIKEALTKFSQYKSRLPEKDIGRYDLHNLEDTIDRIEGAELGSKEALTTGTFPVVPDSEVLYNGPFGQLSIPETEEASCELGRGTKWCTAAKEANNFFNRYNNQGPLYIWRDKNGSKYQFHWPTLQFMDSEDRRLPKETINYFRTEHPILKKLFAKEEKEILKDPRRALDYSKEIIQGRWPEVEPMIANDPKTALKYAKDVIKGRWPEVEELLALDPKSAYLYAEEVLKKRRFRLGEPAIAQHPEWSFFYAQNIIKGRWPEGEAAIAQHAYYAAAYASSVLKNRFPKGEEEIARDPTLALEYAKNIIHGRWPKGEPFISQDPWKAYLYAKDVIKGKWPKGEDSIAQDTQPAYYYATEVLKDRWPEGEEAIYKVREYKELYKDFLRSEGYKV